MALLEDVIKAIVTGCMGGLTLGITNFIANFYVIPWLTELDAKHKAYVDKLKKGVAKKKLR
jgi:hypothetical protein